MSESTAHGRQLLKEKICLTALRLFHKRGIRQVKMDDIATTLSVSKRTLYEILRKRTGFAGGSLPCCWAWLLPL